MSRSPPHRLLVVVKRRWNRQKHVRVTAARCWRITVLCRGQTHNVRGVYAATCPPPQASSLPFSSRCNRPQSPDSHVHLITGFPSSALQYVTGTSLLSPVTLSIMPFYFQHLKPGTWTLTSTCLSFFLFTCWLLYRFDTMSVRQMVAWFCPTSSGGSTAQL